MKSKMITEEDIHGYVDGVLSDERYAQVEAYLRTKPEEAARVQAYRRQNDLLRQHFKSVLQEPVPERLRQSVPGGLIEMRPRMARRILQVAAGIAVIFLSGLAGWTMRDHFGQIHQESARQNIAGTAVVVDLPRRAALAHVIYSPAVERPKEIAADHEDQLIDWLSQRLELQVRPPKLHATGFELIGARVVSGQAGPIVQFMYHNSLGERITLYVCTQAHTGHDRNFHFDQEGVVNVFYWTDGSFGYAVSSGIQKAELEQVTQTAFDQLTHR